MTRSLKLLQGAIRASEFTQTDVDERIGRRRGYLSHVFQRRVDLKLIDLLRVLEVLRVSPNRFFAAVASEGKPSGSGVLQLIAGQLAAEKTPAAAAHPTTAPHDDAALEVRIRKALRSILSQLGQEQSATG